MAKCKIKPVQLSRSIEQSWEAAPLDWIYRIQPEPGSTLLVLEIPADKLADFGPERGYWCHSTFARTHDGQPCLVVQLNSFDLTQGPGNGWAIPFTSQARDEVTLFRQRLGFTEGWEASFPELILRCGPEWAGPMSELVRATQWGVTVGGHDSLYPMPILEPQRKAIVAFVRACQAG